MKYKVPFIKPDFPDADDVAADYKEILAANWFTNFGPFERKFAESIGNYIGDGYYAATSSSATSALLASIIAVFGKGNGSKYVLMPSFTFAAGADTLVWCGYKPLFIDIENRGFHMSIDEAEKVLEQREDSIAGILFCNAFGVGVTNIDAWEALSEKWSKPLILDSAAGFGSLYSAQRKVGSAGKCEIFSFHATKPFAIGEGGAVISKDKKMIESLRSIQNFGFETKGNATQLGFNGKMQEINAAIGLRQLKRFDTTLKMRRMVYGRYKAELDPDKFYFQENARRASLCFVTVIVKNSHSRDKYLLALNDAGVEARAYYTPAIHQQTYFKNAEMFGDLRVTNEVNRTIISLPVHDNMRLEDIDLIVDTLNETSV